MVKYTDRERDAILREARHNIRGRRALDSPSAAADADGWDSCMPQPAAAAPIVIDSRDEVAAAVPSPWSERMRRERRALELDALERRAAKASMRQVEQRQAIERRSARNSPDEIAALRGEVVELGQGANAAVTAVLDRMDAMAAEIAALRTRCEVLEGRKAKTGLKNNPVSTRATRSKKPETLPAFLPSRRLSS
jgi:hypothetical protein